MASRQEEKLFRETHPPFLSRSETSISLRSPMLRAPPQPAFLSYRSRVWPVNQNSGEDDVYYV
uniref:Uncharacterized protein n=1 Tax=Tarenaya spinosa TaxID=228870 RepID=Q1KUZ0_9ROSI|nr:hypothetical protein [Tarenaya spinosa]